MKATEKPSQGPPESLWYIRLLGRLEVVSPSNEIVRFRSRTAVALLAFLALNKTRECSHDQLLDLFWPDSDGDQQAQNLRRAIADLRGVLEEGMPLGSVVVTRKSFVSLDQDRLTTDVERFLHLTSKPNDDGEQARLEEAVNLYAGPLLATLAHPWVLAHQLEVEERFGQAIERLCGILIKQGRFEEARRVGRNAAVVAPSREDVHIALIRAYNVSGMGTEALLQFEKLERMLDENWGELPSERARHALDGSKEPVSGGIREAPTYDGDEHPEVAIPDLSGGAMPMTSKFYVRRAADAEAEACIERGEGVVLVQGPRQVGKSSLVARILAHARLSHRSVVFTDLQAMGESQLVEEGLFYKTLAQSVADQLDLELNIEQEWRAWLGSNMNLNAIFGKLLKRCNKPVCWGIDEADLLFDRPYTNDFFGLLRSWHNRRAMDPEGPWGNLTLLLTYATEAHLFISDLNQSPFNVGVRLTLRDFSEQEVAALKGRYSSISGPDLGAKVFRITNGHPYLSQRAFAFLASGGTMDELAQMAARQDGPFGPHLTRMLVSISQGEETLSEVKRLLRGEPFENATTRYRLQSAGIISTSAERNAVFRVPMYETFLREEIG